MSAYLDLDDAAAPHPVAVKELAKLRAERDRLRSLTFCGCGDQFSAHDPGTCGACLTGATCGKEIDKRAIERLTAERDRLRDALIACRPHIEAALSRDPQARQEQLRLLDTIDEAAKGGT